MDIFLDISLKPPQPLMGLFFDKTVIWDRIPPDINQMQCICVGGLKGPKSSNGIQLS